MLCFGLLSAFTLAALLISGCTTRTQEAQKPTATAASALASNSIETNHPAPAGQKAETKTPGGMISSQAWSERLKQAAAKPSLPFEGLGWDAIFDGTLKGWSETKFSGRGEVECQSDLLVLNMGDPFTGVNYTNDFPKMNYEIALDAMRLMGSDFFCGLTIPVGDAFCSLIVGGWGGSLLGISSLDGMDASENETTKYVTFENGRWYRIRLRITEGRIEGWLDNEKLINVLTKDRRISLRPGEIELSKPMGVACWQCSSALREIRLRRVDQPDGPPKKY